MAGQQVVPTADNNGDNNQGRVDPWKVSLHRDLARRCFLGRQLLSPGTPSATRRILGESPASTRAGTSTLPRARMPQVVLVAAPGCTFRETLPLGGEPP
jgi:hypothetical protein